VTASRLCLIVVHDCVVGWLSLTKCTVHTVLRIRAMFIEERRIRRVWLALRVGKDCLLGFGREICRQEATRKKCAKWGQKY
jgi:hypothetical protein